MLKVHVYRGLKVHVYVIEEAIIMTVVFAITTASAIKEY